MLNIIADTAALGSRLRRFAVRLHRSESGIELVSFAVALPVVLTMGLVGLETANFALAHLRVSNIAAGVGDNAARVRDSIDEADVNELLLGGMVIGRPIDFEQNGRIILSSLEAWPDDANKQWIRWQRCDGNRNENSNYGKPLDSQNRAIIDGTEIYATNRTSPSASPSTHLRSTMTEMGRAGNKIKAQPGTAVMVVEVVYQYQPIMANATLAGTEIRYLNAFNVRQRNNQSITNSGRIAPSACL